MEQGDSGGDRRRDPLKWAAIVVLAVLAALWIAAEARGADGPEYIFAHVIVEVPEVELGLRFFGPQLHQICVQRGGVLHMLKRDGVLGIAPDPVIETVEIVLICKRPPPGADSGGSRMTVSRSKDQTGVLGWP